MPQNLLKCESGCTNNVHSLHPRANMHQILAPDIIQVPSLPTHLEGSSGQLDEYPDAPSKYPRCPCDENGHYLPIGTPPPLCCTATHGDWKPFEDEVQFKVANFLYRQEEMLQGNINYLLELWVLSLMKHNNIGPFDTYKHICDRIDAVEEGDAPWKCFKTSLNKEVGDTAPNWKKQEYNIW
ncbi:hypothetical protein BYT27DRAFT_7255758 [Phlegmacium glaucopus]|nr:hypothetical protein BYT27DRAFT_7255758 [Phlegmacium glaucopus]